MTFQVTSTSKNSILKADNVEQPIKVTVVDLREYNYLVLNG